MVDLSQVLEVDEAAARLNVSRRELYRLIQEGALDAFEFAGRLAVPVEALRRLELAPRPVGRPFSPNAAWALLRMVSHLDVPELSASRRSQLRRHLRDGHPDDLAGRLRSRAARHAWFVHPSMQRRLLDDQRFLPSGLSALDAVGADLVASEDVVEAYVEADALAAVADEVGALDEAAVRNVVLHVVGDLSWVPQRIGLAAPAVVALDLIESGDPRAVAAGHRLWREQLADYEGRDG